MSDPSASSGQAQGKLRVNCDALPSNEQEDKRSVATGADSSNGAGIVKKRGVI